jgi:hypothetical protein
MCPKSQGECERRQDGQHLGTVTAFNANRKDDPTSTADLKSILKQSNICIRLFHIPRHHDMRIMECLESTLVVIMKTYRPKKQLGRDGLFGLEH